MASIVVTDYGTDYISVNVSGLGSTAKYIEFYIDDDLDKYYTLSGTSKSHTYAGLDAGTRYKLSAIVYNSNWEVLTFKANTVYQTTEDLSSVTVNYYDGSSSDSDTGTSVTVKSAYRSGWTFVGWSTSTGSTSISYEAGDEISGGSYDMTINLYAVYKQETTINFYYITSSTGSLSSNSRTKIQYRVNTSKTAYSTNYYNNVTCPSFSSSNQTITTTTPGRTWTAAGWIQGTSAASPDYSAGQSVATNLISGDLYAIYSNECSITYNSNGGSGSITKQSGTGYYNASGSYIGVTFTIKECTFTPPSGKMFKIWNAQSDGSGTQYSPNVTITTSYNTIFYAIWKNGRPNNWSWTSAVTKGASIPFTKSGSIITCNPLTATEWLAFGERIKSFAAYLDVTVDSTYWYRMVNGVSSGSPMTTTQANAALYLINALNPPTAVPDRVSAGNGITAAFINGLKNSLNSIK